ncbi:uncharacterized protein LOC105427041 [Pogonomyrmex barbatus]|uniref:Uncharacterized protein LOC105427041 n=1 Tax=Pogonomyrmex barbatus TaxID=144034 RepID=A0A6I9WY27_9HYME|nr:uncharacterized protein LOC105427041 [Pogonomyrmex barbatus]
MIYIDTIGILTFFLILGNLEALIVINHHSDDEYVLEHEVLRKDALAQAKKLEIHSGHVPGCQVCIYSEIIYCKNGSIINDHCCCDGRFNDFFTGKHMPTGVGSRISMDLTKFVIILPILRLLV